jgi:hypothetical protein
MRRDVQRMPKSREKSTRKTHAMINQCKDMCIAEKEKQVLNL